MRSIGFRIFALVIVPMVVVGGLVAERIDSASRRIDIARRLDTLTARAAEAGRLQAVLSIDRAATQGIVLINETQVTVEQTSELIELDLSVIVEVTEEMVLDAAERYRRVGLPDNGAALDALLATRTPLLDPQSGLGVADLIEVYDRLDQELQSQIDEIEVEIDALVASGVGSTALGIDLSGKVSEARTFNRLVRATGQQASTLVLLVGRRAAALTDAPTRAGAAAGVIEEARAELANQLATGDATWLASEAMLHEKVATAMRQAGLLTEPPIEMDVIEQSKVAAQVGAVTIDWLQAAQPRFDEFLTRLQARSTALIRDSEAQSREGSIVAGVIAVFTLTWTAVVTASLTRPIRRLTDRAAVLSRGDFQVAKAAVRGPSEVRNLATTLDQLAGNLEVVDRQVDALGHGRLSDDVLDVELPGHFGARMRQSILRATELTERLAHQARRDVLTGIPNRAAALDRIGEAIDRSGRVDGTVAVLFIDLDGFKAVNDSSGHEAGDRVLVEIAERFSGSVRGGELVARLGGDEFVVIAEGVDSVGTVVALAERLIARAEAPISLGDQSVRLSASIGVATSNIDSTPTSLLGQADHAVYEAKRRGKAQVVCFDAELQAHAERRADIEHALKSAIANNEFRLFVQPIVDANGRVVRSGEALLRWERPGHGLILPGDFIPIAEESWLIVDIGRWVLDEACRLIARWSDAGIEMPLAVNIAGRHLAEADLVADVEEALSRHRIASNLLTVELTETQLVTDLERGASVLERLRGLGVRVALDDFGTGYSSLNYLRQLPIDIVKIDRSYIVDLPHNAQAGSIVAGIRHLAETLGLVVVVEGVETQGQAEFLEELGCDKLQGFLFAKPMPTGQFEQALASTAPRVSARRGTPL
jgi:diguanylate cyclase (GGDEF)-like protein